MSIFYHIYFFSFKKYVYIFSSKPLSLQCTSIFYFQTLKNTINFKKKINLASVLSQFQVIFICQTRYWLKTFTTPLLYNPFLTRFYAAKNILHNTYDAIGIGGLQRDRASTKVFIALGLQSLCIMWVPDAIKGCVSCISVWK